MALTLVILAAGTASRFGGNKQIEPVGPAGQFLFEYSVYDALLAGFDHLVFVVSESFDNRVISQRLNGYNGQFRIDFAVQTLTACTGSAGAALAQRNKPWGTAHAVLVTQPYINNPFVVINADDFYGRSNFIAVAGFLREQGSGSKEGVMPGYSLDKTLSESGGVNRGICSVSADGYLLSIHETRNIQMDSNLNIRSDTKAGLFSLNATSTVSMTFWGFQPAVMSLFEIGFSDFLSTSANSADAECYIPDVIDFGLRTNALSVRVLPTSEKWLGMTYRADLDRVVRHLQDLTRTGVYPAYPGSDC